MNGEKNKNNTFPKLQLRNDKMIVEIQKSELSALLKEGRKRREEKFIEWVTFLELGLKKQNSMLHSEKPKRCQARSNLAQFVF